MPEVVLGAQGGSSAYLPTPTWPISSLAPSSHQTRNMVTNSPKTGDQTSGKVLGTRHSSRKPQSNSLVVPVVTDIVQLGGFYIVKTMKISTGKVISCATVSMPSCTFYLHTMAPLPPFNFKMLIAPSK